MKRLLKIIFFIIIASSAGFVVYSMVVIVKARRETPQIIQTALKAPHVTLQVTDLNAWQLQALLKIEDPAFYTHAGIDFKTPGAGITTITQNLVKIFYFEHFTPGFAKIKQTLIARFALNSLVSKNDQLRLFINYVYLGRVNDQSVIGFDQAAQRYYHKTIAQLSEQEYLSIVAMIASPQGFHLLERPAANAERTTRLQKVVAGVYHPKHLMDLYYGKVDQETQKYLAPASYFPSLYEN
jgi:membrane carboxypeptidase/penicillin-binding protein